MRVNLTVGSLILIAIVIAIIGVLPPQFCLFGVCLDFTSLISFKNLINYFFRVGVLFGLIGLTGAFIFKSIKFLQENDFVKSLINFLISFEEDDYNALVKTVSKKNQVTKKR